MHRILVASRLCSCPRSHVRAPLCVPVICLICSGVAVRGAETSRFPRYPKLRGVLRTLVPLCFCFWVYQCEECSSISVNRMHFCIGVFIIITVILLNSTLSWNIPPENAQQSHYASNWSAHLVQLFFLNNYYYYHNDRTDTETWL